MDLLTNCSLQVQRRIYNPTTKQSTMGAVGPAFACYIRDITLDLKERGLAAEFILKVTCDGTVDLRDGDMVTGFTGYSLPNRPATLQVDHVEHKVLPDGSGDSYKVAHIIAQE